MTSVLVAEFARSMSATLIEFCEVEDDGLGASSRLVLPPEGLSFALDPRMGVSRVEDLDAWRLARAFKLEVYRLIAESEEARRDYRFKSQLSEAAMGGESNIAEGFRRWVAGEFCHFLSYASASIEEAVRRVQDGIDRGYFLEGECRRAFQLGDEAGRTTGALRRSLQPFIGSLSEILCVGHNLRSVDVPQTEVVHV